jgi:hypothetical protein
MASTRRSSLLPSAPEPDAAFATLKRRCRFGPNHRRWPRRRRAGQSAENLHRCLRAAAPWDCIVAHAGEEAGCLRQRRARRPARGTHRPWCALSRRSGAGAPGAGGGAAYRLSAVHGSFAYSGILPVTRCGRCWTRASAQPSTPTIRRTSAVTSMTISRRPSRVAARRRGRLHAGAQQLHGELCRHRRETALDRPAGCDVHLRSLARAPVRERTG